MHYCSLVLDSLHNLLKALPSVEFDLVTVGSDLHRAGFAIEESYRPLTHGTVSKIRRCHREHGLYNYRSRSDLNISS